MPVKNSSEYGIDTLTVSTRDAAGPKAEISLHPAEDGYHARMVLSVTGSRGQTSADLKQVLGVSGQAQSHYARSSHTSYEVPREGTAAVLKKLGLPEDLGGRSGVTISFSHDSADNGKSSITIEARDPKLAKFTPAHAGVLEDALVKTPGMVPEPLKVEVIKSNPGFAASIQIDSRSHGGTRIEFKPIESGNLSFSILHNASTGLDEIVLRATNNPQQMQELHTRVSEHLKTNGINPAGSNIDSVIRSATEYKGSPATSETHLRTGGVIISLPQGSGEKALGALSKPAQFTVGDVRHHSAPIVAPEIAKAAAPEMEATVRKVAVAEHEAHVASARSGGKPVNFGNILTRLGVAAITATGAGVAAAAQAPEGQRLEAGAKAAGKAMAEQALPGVTETDTCKQWGASVGAVGGALGAVVGGGGAILGTGATAIPSLGTSVAASPWTTAAGVLLGGMAGQQAGEMLGEGACRLVQAGAKAAKGDAQAVAAAKPPAGEKKSHLDDKTKALLATPEGSTAFMDSLKKSMAAAKTPEEKQAIQGVITEATQHIAALATKDYKPATMQVAEASRADNKVPASAPAAKPATHGREGRG